MLTPDGQVTQQLNSFHIIYEDWDTVKRSGGLLTVTTNPVTENICGIKNINAKYVKLTLTKCPGQACPEPPLPSKGGQNVLRQV